VGLVRRRREEQPYASSIPYGGSSFWLHRHRWRRYFHHFAEGTALANLHYSTGSRYAGSLSAFLFCQQNVFVGIHTVDGVTLQCSSAAPCRLTLIRHRHHLTARFGRHSTKSISVTKFAAWREACKQLCPSTETCSALGSVNSFVCVYETVAQCLADSL
jgi:hypothetical protein